MSSAGGQGRGKLDRERVLAAAVDLADRVGVAGTSMRRLAEEIGVTPMALYKHVAHREQLLDAMVDRVIEEIEAPAAGTPWKAAVRARIFSARAAARRHPWFQEAIETRTMATPTVLAYMDALMAEMFAGGLSADLVHHAMHALSTRMWGFTRDVLPTPDLPDDPHDRAEALEGFAARYPAIIRMATAAHGAGAHCDADAEFAFALDILLNAFERLDAAGWSSV